MGYETDYNGVIHLKNKEAMKIINELIEKGEEPFNYVGGGNIEVYEDSPKDIFLEINTYLKDYDDEMLKLCLFVSIIDKKSHGVIECGGEDKEDVWRIVVGEGKVIREQGYITYKTGFKFEDIKTKKKVYGITKDKTLLKELIVEGLK